MSLLRHALGRLLGALFGLGLFALFLNALVLSAQHRQERDAALAGPPPGRVPLGRLEVTAPLREVAVLARLGAAIDLGPTGGSGRVVPLYDPSDAPTAPARAAVYVAEADLPAFEAMLAANTRPASGEARLVALNGVVALPFAIDRAKAALAAAGRGLAPDARFIRPFLHGRAAGLAQDRLPYIVPAVLFALLLALVWMQARRAIRHGRALRARKGLDALDHEVEQAAALAQGLQPGDPLWVDLASRRHSLRQKRARLDAALAAGGRGGHLRLLWLLAIGCGALLGIVPLPVLSGLVSQHLLGTDPAALMSLPAAEGALRATQDLLALPGAALADLVLAVFGPQSVKVASGIRLLPFALCAGCAALFLLGLSRRIGPRRPPRGKRG